MGTYRVDTKENLPLKKLSCYFPSQLGVTINNPNGGLFMPP